MGTEKAVTLFLLLAIAAAFIIGLKDSQEDAQAVLMELRNNG